MNTGELKKCERQHFTDWHWPQFEQAGLLPGPVQIPSNSNYYAPRHRLEAYAIKVVDLQLSLSEKSFNSDLELTLGRTPVTRKSLEY